MIKGSLIIITEINNSTFFALGDENFLKLLKSVVNFQHQSIKLK